MKFSISHTFDNVTLDDYAKLYFDEDFNAKLCEAVKLEREPISFEQGDASWRRAVKVVPDRTLPAPVAKVLGTDRLSYTEHLEFNPSTQSGTWKSESGVMTDKVLSSGTFRFEQSGSGVKRTVDGEVKVKIFGVGGMIEKAVVADIEKSYEAAAKFTKDWLQSRNA